MITKTDLILLLTELQQEGVNVDDDLMTVRNSQSIPLTVLKNINNAKPMDIISFYEKLRKSYNTNKSKLYINILKSDEDVIKDPKIILTTLSALLNQILQYKANDKVLFFSNSRAEEITRVLNIYFKTYDIEPAIKLLNLFKADIVVLEISQGKRNYSF